jgi:uncharacterized membrane protein YhaH (DUF805 family)
MMNKFVLLAQQYDGGQAAGAALPGLLMTLVYLIISVFFIVVMWRVFVKAGQPGWGSIIPFYNIILMLRIAGKPGWWLVFFFIPIINIVVQIVMLIDIAKNFGRGGWFAAGLIFLPIIFFPILAFGSSVYGGASQPAGG